MSQDSILVLGAGMAGLAAAEELARRGLPVTVVEGRDRVGGRVHTIYQSGLEAPVEVGAEFIHGAKNATWPYLRKARFKTDELPDRHWELYQGTLAENRNFWEQLSAVTEKIELAAPDQDFCSFLKQVSGVSDTARWLATEYVEGFHAAPAERISVHTIARAEAAAEREDGMRQFRLKRGYAGLADWFLQQLNKRVVPVKYQHVVKTICWEPGEVEVQAATPEGPVILRGRLALVTLPLGVLKEEGPTGVLFEPPLTEKQTALKALEPAAVIKVVFHFRSGFWPENNFGFLHTDDPNFPTWWVNESGPLLTGWAGGPRAERLSKESRETILAEAIESLTRVFKVERRRLQELLVEGWTHDWTNDRYSRGAYSYMLVGMGQMAGRLSEPVQDTLFFAGEATAEPGDQGTVHGALGSAKRAVEQIRKSSRPEVRKPRRKVALSIA